MNKSQHEREQGVIDGWMISTVLLIICVIGASTFGIWSYLNYQEQKTNVDAKIDGAVAAAKKTQADEDEKKFLERENQPYREFVGPDDYGRLSFMYPKTWSVYVARDISKGGDFEAYLHPITVPPVSVVEQFALRVTIEERQYEDVVDRYSRLVEKGDLSSSTFPVNGQNGTRLDGNFSKDIRGSAVVFKIRDKTVVVRTDADVFKPIFEEIISSINYNQ